MRFAVASCQAYQSGFFNAYAHIVDDDPDFLLFLGDYIYELEASRAARQHAYRIPQTLDEFPSELRLAPLSGISTGSP